MRRFVWVLLTAFAAAGCFRSDVPMTPRSSDARLAQGLVIVLTGIEGRSAFNEAICEGLNDGGVGWAIELEDWTTRVPMNYLVNLRNELRNRQKAEEIADRIVRYQMAHPGKPVILVGQSGGGAMAAWIVEALPPTDRIDGVIMLAASLSPQYGLDATLAKCTRGVVNFHSARDWFMLGIGTTLSGTMDGAHTSSAGKVGFEVPLSESRAKLYYRKLFQVAWQPAMAEAGYTGNHMTSGGRQFVTSYVAPLVLEKKWNRETVANLCARGTTTWPGPGSGYRADMKPSVATAPSKTTMPATSVPSTAIITAEKPKTLHTQPRVRYWAQSAPAASHKTRQDHVKPPKPAPLPAPPPEDEPPLSDDRPDFGPVK